MSKGNISDTQLARASDIWLALGLLTRLPLPAGGAPERGAQAAWAWPLAGLVLGLLGVGMIWLGRWFDLPGGLISALVLAVMILASGALHEDGLADMADGIWGGWTVEQRLDIMRDSRIGTYGVLALVLSLLARWSLIGALLSTPLALVAAAVIGRAPMVTVMALVRPAREDGLSRNTGQPEGRTAWLSAGVAMIIAITLTGWAGVMACVVAYLVAGAVAWLAHSKIGGQTGDVLGASQQLAEIAALAVLVTSLSYSVFD
ncbi:adenosylcobinamide-GDP ribazoletransferase [Rhodophyticola sp. CCM32]|nr:adenosylcobinamide-GDP ribazoletransferase [Rhodophyticola sp. CCM32]QBY02641.1 adenosylcobinamide-GDP ribazoletransferase [Rhodophyticola sp. CCM32]